MKPLQRQSKLAMLYQILFLELKDTFTFTCFKLVWLHTVLDSQFIETGSLPPLAAIYGTIYILLICTEAL